MWNQIKDPDINPYTYKHLISKKKKLKVYIGKIKAYSTNGVGITDVDM